MNRRLYFMFPSKSEAGAAIDDLVAHEGVSRSRMHVLARVGVNTEGLPIATAGQKRDLRAHIAWWLWEIDLGLFAVALISLIVAWFIGSFLIAVLAVSVIAATFVGGVVYAMRLPEVSLEEFRGALAHGELLLMVDVPPGKVPAVEHQLRHHHKSAIAGGSSWTISGLAI